MLYNRRRGVFKEYVKRDMGLGVEWESVCVCAERMSGVGEWVGARKWMGAREWVDGRKCVWGIVCGERECVGEEEVYGGRGSVCRESVLYVGGRECVGWVCVEECVLEGVCWGGGVSWRRSVREVVREEVVGIRMRSSENYNKIF